MVMGINDIVAENYGWILSRARKYCTNLMDAEDLAGEVVYKILSSKERYDAAKSFKAWCSTILLNTYITIYNHNNLVGFVSVDKGQYAISGYNTSSQVYVDEVYAALDSCRNKSCAIDCVRKYSEGYSYDEISRMYSIPVGTVRSRISFARNIFRKELEIR